MKNKKEKNGSRALKGSKSSFDKNVARG